MAIKKVMLEVLVTDKGIEVTQKKVEKLNTTTDKVSKTANKAKRNLEGVAQRSNRAGKDFSRLSQGMGGMVQAYATVAAQVFALTAAYAVLKNAADFRSMEISTENLSTVTGRSFTLITESILKATRGMLDYQEAMATANKIGTVGLDITKIEQLSELAVKASQTFGGTTTDAINRFVGAIQKGETELVKQVGIALNLQQTLNQYAAELGTTAEKLGVFQKQQALANAILVEGERVLGGIQIDANPYEQLGASFRDLGIQALQVLKIIDPVINTLKDSMLLLTLIMVSIGTNIAVKALPAITQFADSLSANSKQQAIVSQRIQDRNNAEAASFVKNQNDKMTASLKLTQQAKESQNALSTVSAHAKGKKPTKTMAGFAANFIDAETKNFDVKLAERLISQTKRALSIYDANIKNGVTTKLRGNKALSGVPSAIIDSIDSGNVGAVRDLQKSSEKQVSIVKGAQAAIQKETKKTGKVAAQTFRQMATSATTSAAQVKVSFGKAMGNVQKQFLEGGVGAGFKQIFTSMDMAGKMGGEVGKKTAFLSRAMAGLGGSLSFAVTGLTKMAGVISGITITIAILTTAWTYLAPMFDNTSKAAKNFATSIEEVNGNLEETGKKTEQLLELQTRYKDTTGGVAAELQFLAGAMSDYRDQIVKVTTAFSILRRYQDSELDTRVRDHIAEQSKEVGILTRAFIFMGEVMSQNSSGGYTPIPLTAGELNDKEMEAAAIDSYAIIVETLNQASKTMDASSVGINLKKNIIAGLKVPSQSAIATDALKQILNLEGSGEEIKDQLSEIYKSLGPVQKRAMESIMGNIDTTLNVSTDALGQYNKLLADSNNANLNYSKSLNDLKTKDLVDKETVSLLGSAIDSYEAIETLQKLNIDDKVRTNKLVKQQSENLADLPIQILRMVEKQNELDKKVGDTVGGLRRLKETLESINNIKAIAKANIELQKLKETSLKSSLKDMTTVSAVVVLNEKILATTKARLSSQIVVNKQSIAELRMKRDSFEIDEVGRRLAQDQINVLEAKNAQLEANKETAIINLNIEKQILEVYKRQFELLNKVSSSKGELLSQEILGATSASTKQAQAWLAVERKARDIIAEQLDAQTQILKIQRAKTTLLTDDNINNSERAEQLAQHDTDIAALQKTINLKDSSRALTVLSLLAENRKADSIQAQLQDQIKLNVIQLKSLKTIEKSTYFATVAAEASAAHSALTLKNAEALVIAKKLEVAQTYNDLQSKIKVLTFSAKQESFDKEALISQMLGAKNSLNQLNIKKEELQLLKDKEVSLNRVNRLEQAKSFDRSMFENLGTTMQSEAEVFGEFFADSFAKSFKKVKGPLETVAAGVVKTLDSAISELGNAIVEADVTLRDAVEAIKDVMRDVVKEFFVSGIKTIINQVVSYFFGGKDDTAELNKATNVRTTEILMEQLTMNRLHQGQVVKRYDRIIAILERIAPGVVNKEGGVDSITVPGTLKTGVQGPPVPGSVMDESTRGIPQGIDAKGNNKFGEGLGKASEALGALEAVVGENTTIGQKLQEIQVLKYAWDTTVGIANWIKSLFVDTVATGATHLNTAAVVANTVALGMNAVGSTYANGGIVSMASPQPKFQAFATGGITNGPTMALMGEGSNREAVVPLPNNREIPVNLKGGGGGGNTTTINQSFDFRNADGDSVGRLRAEAEKIKKETFDKVFTEMSRGGKYSKLSGRRK
jgi:hypothetical protein